MKGNRAGLDARSGKLVPEGALAAALEHFPSLSTRMQGSRQLMKRAPLSDRMIPFDQMTL